MRVARVRLTLWLTTAVAAAGAVAALVAATLLPLDVPSDARPGTQSRRPASASTTLATLPPLESFESAWRLPLRRPLVDPPATESAVPAAAAVKPPAPPIRLVGTIVDSRRPRGVFMTGLATIELKGVGETAGGAKILAIDDNSATLTYEGDTIVLRRERTPFDPSGDAYDNAPDRPAAAAPAAESKGDGG
jgi:hypothetical protein